jgi:hypothetical protein
MAGCTVQTGRNWSAYFGLAQPLRLVAHLSGDRGGHLANGGAGGLQLAGSGVGGEVVLGWLGNAAHPSGDLGQGGPHRKNKIYSEV